PKAVAPGVTPVKGDLMDAPGLTAILRGHEVVVSATKFLRTDARQLLSIVKAAGVPRWIVVGGAGSLEAAPGVALVDTPEFPADYKKEALAGRDFLAVLRGEQAVSWTFLSPPAMLLPGPRTGTYRVGGDQLLLNAAGESRITVADYACALVDEIEQPRHAGRRFTVAD
ncbi:MAG TPA: NAD(P)H-binding protein, partial [Opitutus sp.]|nr:NAD(P)H-binding protein [Opitutus sp.]